jgi:solute carrier family 25 thiamine pyrophosphate transporter 19
MGLSFGIFSALSQWTTSATSVQGVLQTIGNGALAGFASKLIVYPLDTVKKRMQMQGVSRHADYGIPIPNYASSYRCVIAIVRQEGVIALYKGTLPSLIKSMVTHSSTFTVYEVTSAILRHLHE